MTVALALLLPVLPASAASTLPVWGSEPSPNLGERSNVLLGVEVLDEADVWAVGQYESGQSVTRTLAEHWDGAQWEVVPTPNPSFSGLDLATLEAVSGINGDDVWAVGHGDDLSSFKTTTLVQHWDGTAWRIVASPNPGGANRPNKLFDVLARTATDVVAVGEQGFPAQALIMRWNGSRWAAVPNTCGGGLSGITSVPGTNTMWAVGSDTTCYFDGRRWVRVNPPNSPILEDVSAVSARHVWAVGRQITCFPKFCQSEATILVWNGTRWIEASHPVGDGLFGVHVVAADDIWAVGNEGPGTDILHWNGRAWTAVPSPNPDNHGEFYAVDAAGPVAVWSVGYFNDEQYDRRTFTVMAPSSTKGQIVGRTTSFGVISWVGPVSGSTDSGSTGGPYDIPDLPPGEYLLIATDSFGGCDPGIANVTVVAGQTTMQDLRPDC